MLAGRRKSDAKRPGNGAGHGGPARGNGSPAAPPFDVGNSLARTHGAFSTEIVDPVAAELVETVLVDPAVSYLTEPRFRAELNAWARAEAMVILIRDWLAARGGLFEDDGSERAAVRTLDRAESRSQSGRDRLGLNPAAAARLGRDVAAAQAAQVTALERLRADGRAIAEARGVLGGGGDS